ncbi:hypothetical protein [Allohahella marinimesophila]|uniref:MSHA biogenesis protein MshI n=1 Tax=Allohahella marinimesophila TaxID=1054972 RepID=A0ABP7NXH6_9GAMM
MQQVNLYTEAFRPKRDWFSPASMAWCLGIVVGLILIYSAVLMWQDSIGETELLALQPDTTRLQLEVSELTQTLEQRARDTGLQAQQETLQQRLQNTNMLLGTIQGRLLNERADASFFAILLALGKHTTGALWLEEIVIENSGARLQLAGQTSEPQLLPRYLQALGKEAAFAGRAFNGFRLSLDQPDGQKSGQGLDARRSSDSSGSGPYRAFSVDTHTEDADDA